jgi:hypothetical protein
MNTQPGLVGFRRTSTLVSQVLAKPQYASYHESGIINSSSLGFEQEQSAVEMIKRLSSNKISPKYGAAGGPKKQSTNFMESIVTSQNL